jgi:predicted small lipoprotein YifL
MAMIAAMMRVAILCLFVPLLAACGQKSALYLPDRKSEPVAASPAAPAATPAEPDRSDEPRKKIH